MDRMLGMKRKQPPRRLVGEPHAEYTFAVQEYHHTVAPQSSNDDGLSHFSGYESQNASESPSIERSSSNGKDEEGNTQQPQSFFEDRRPARKSNSDYSVNSNNNNANTHLETINEYEKENRYVYNLFNPDSDEASAYMNHMPRATPTQEATMPDATYEEQYGDAYVGAPIKYVYPSGYQSMRPRGGPWKLSIAICVLFTWLSVFIVGHCSDRVDQSQYQHDIDDDALVIETRWCGSRLLYFMWVMSMLVTGLAAAYCSVIGYIKVRDFAVANCRSQPPGISGRSDYYVRIEDGPLPRPPAVSGQHHPYSNQYQKTIYQADGTPQFWGGYIYRPTQAAVAVTSR